MHRRALRARFVAGPAALLALLTSACGGAGTPAASPAAHHPATTSADSSPALHSKPPKTTKSKPPAKPKVWPANRVDAAIRAVKKKAPDVAVSVAAFNTATGKSYSFGKKSGMWTASVYKLYLLEVLLREHQQSGSSLSSYEQDAATRAIENSDNAAGYQLYEDVGGNGAMASGFDALGLHHTVPGATDPTFTRSSAPDAIRLLKNLVGRHGPLDSASQNYAIGLMQQVEADQRWGVGVVADKGDNFANKNGWISVSDGNGPDEDDGGRWAVNSVGIVKVHGTRVLMAVFTKHNSDFFSGKHLVQLLARATVKAVVPQPAQ